MSISLSKSHISSLISLSCLGILNCIISSAHSLTLCNYSFWNLCSFVILFSHKYHLSFQGIQEKENAKNELLFLAKMPNLMFLGKMPKTQSLEALILGHPKNGFCQKWNLHIFGQPSLSSKGKILYPHLFSLSRHFRTSFKVLACSLFLLSYLSIFLYFQGYLHGFE